MPATYRMQAEIPAQAMAVPRSGCRTISPKTHQHRRGRGQQRVAHVVDGLAAALEKVREKQNQDGLGQLRRLKRQAPRMNPAMRVMRTVEKEYGDEQQRGKAHQRKHQRGMLVAAVVHAHGDDHGDKSSNPTEQLLRQERIRRSKLFTGHHRRRREHHHQSDKDQQHGDGEQPAIDAHALCHGISFHHGVADRTMRKSWIVGFRLLTDVVQPTGTSL